jgi:phosphoethanolamine N-methyltransferase
MNAVDPGYPEPCKLELIWGDGFLSPGGAAEVARIIGDKDIAGRDILDIGGGMGGADIALVKNHGARSVVGIDVERQLVEAASRRAQNNGLEDLIRYQLVEPGALPFATSGFDVVFSKDAIIHVEDKESLYREIFRVLRPGGRLLVSDWLRGKGDHFDSLVEDFITASGHRFFLASLEQLGGLARAVGFVDIELEDRQEWYMQESEAELRKLHGPLGQEFRRRWGDKAADDEIAFWEVLVAAVKAGAMKPGHIRASKQ